MHNRRSCKPYTALDQSDTAGSEGQQTEGGERNNGSERMSISAISGSPGNTFIVVLSDPATVDLFRNSVGAFLEAI
jgi:hypothetical protein